MMQFIKYLHSMTNLVTRAMPVRWPGRHWLWGNRQPEPLNLGVPVVGRHVLLINVKPITAQEKFYFPRANAFLSPRTGIALGTRLVCSSKDLDVSGMSQLSP
jgi:hypothetical protein